MCRYKILKPYTFYGISFSQQNLRHRVGQRFAAGGCGQSGPVRRPDAAFMKQGRYSFKRPVFLPMPLG